MPINTADIQAASAGNQGALHRVLTGLVQGTATLGRHLGIDPTPSAQAADAAIPVVDLPRPATLAVSGGNGRFSALITNPLPDYDNRSAAVTTAPNVNISGTTSTTRSRKLNLKRQNDPRRIRRIIHELQSATSADFAQGFISYGASDQTRYDVPAVNETRYWRIHSRYETSGFNPYTSYSDGTTNGPTPVFSSTAPVDLTAASVTGQLGSAKLAKNVMGNYSNNATVDSIDNGTNATIRVYGPGGVGTTWHQFIGAVIGPEQPAFSGATAYNQDTYIVYDGISFTLTITPSAILPDGLLFCAKVHTVSAGGGGGTGGGGGAGGGGGGRLDSVL